MRQPRLTANNYRVLAAIMASPAREMAGAELLRVTGMMSGTLYPLLIKLKAAGWLKARWEVESASSLGRPQRRYYSVTGKGAAHAREYERELLILNPTLASAQKV